MVSTHPLSKTTGTTRPKRCKLVLRKAPTPRIRRQRRASRRCSVIAPLDFNSSNLNGYLKTGRQVSFLARPEIIPVKKCCVVGNYRNIVDSTYCAGSCPKQNSRWYDDGDYASFRSECRESLRHLLSERPKTSPSYTILGLEKHASHEVELRRSKQQRQHIHSLLSSHKLKSSSQTWFAK